MVLRKNIGKMSELPIVLNGLAIIVKYTYISVYRVMNNVYIYIVCIMIYVCLCIWHRFW